MTGSSEEERKESGFRAWKKRTSDSIHNAIDDKKETIVAQSTIRMRNDKRVLQAWREYSHAHQDSEIDYDNPCVHIEWVCCDLDMLMLATSDGEKFLQQTDCDRETFMKYYDQSAAKP